MAVPAPFYGSTSVGTTAVTSGSTADIVYGVRVKASAANSNKVYVGLASTVTAGSTAATDGFELAAGSEIVIPVAMLSNMASLYMIGGAASQKAFFFGV